MEVVHLTTAIAPGDGRNGRAQTEDGLVDLELRVPREMGGEGGTLIRSMTNRSRQRLAATSCPTPSDSSPCSALGSGNATRP